MMALRFKLPIDDFRLSICGTSSYAKATAGMQSAVAFLKEMLSQTELLEIGNRQSLIVWGGAL